MASVTIPCPSCEAGFAVKDSLIGKKVDCPKCKYRFKAELPGDEDAPRKSEKSKKKGGNNTLIIGGVIGALALILLSVGAYFIFAGGDNPKPQANKNSSNQQQRPAVPNAGGETPNAGGGGNSATTESNGGTGGTTGTEATPGAGTGTEKPPATTNSEASKPKPVNPSDLKDITNLLPGETTSVYTVFVDRVVQTPFYNALFDRQTQEFFRNSMTFEVSDIEMYIHCVVNPDRTPFGIFRLKKPLDETALLNRIDNVKGPNSPIKGRYYNTIKSNPFLDALGKALSWEAIRGEFNLPKPEADDRRAPTPQPLAYFVYDSQTLIIASQLELERFLSDLDDKGMPPMKSAVTTDVPPSETPMTPAGGAGGEAAPGSPLVPSSPNGPGTPGGKGMNSPTARTQSGVVRLQQPGGPPTAGTPDKSGRQRGGPGAPGGSGQPGSAGQQPVAPKSYTSNPHYRSIDEEIKYMLNRLEEEDATNPPAIMYAEKIDQRLINQRVLGPALRATGDEIYGVMSMVKVVGGAIRVFNKDKFVASASFDFQNDTDAKTATTRYIQPLMQELTPLLSLFFGTPIDVRNNANGGGGGAGGSGPGIPGGMAPGIAGAEGGPGGPGGPGGGRERPNGSRPRPGGGGAGAPGGFEGVGPPGGGIDGGFGGGTGQGAGNSPSFISINLVDRSSVLGMEILWNEERYKKTILPAIISVSNQLKGRMSVLSGESNWYSLSQAFPKIIDAKKAFPRGTLERELKAERFGLPYPPEQRVSFLADLLPFIGRGGLRSTIQEKKFAWYDKENLPAAESWIPEFLVPYYPQQAWRAYNPLAEGKVLGATNYVGISGLGLDSARYNPADPENAKKVGITGYDWGSTAAEVTDGMSNTIYMLQAPPNFRRPWIAGGGATVVGVDENAANPVQDFVHTAPDKRRGTYALMADGSVRWVPESIDPKVFKGMVTRAGGESLGDLDKLSPRVDPPKGMNVELKGSRTSVSTPKPAPSTTPAPAASTEAVDQAELKNLQGDWEVSLLIYKGKRITKDQLTAAKLVVTIDGDNVRVASAEPTFVSPNSRVVALNPKATPRTITREILDGADKGKKTNAVYEVAGIRMKLRSSDLGQPAPTAVRIPEDNSKDTYMELEKILKE